VRNKPTSDNYVTLACHIAVYKIYNRLSQCTCCPGEVEIQVICSFFLQRSAHSLQKSAALPPRGDVWVGNIKTNRYATRLATTSDQFCGQTETGDRQTADAETQTPIDTVSDNKGRL